MDENTDSDIYIVAVKIKNKFILEKNHENFLTYFQIFIFSSMTVNTTEKVNCILNAHFYRESSQTKISRLSIYKLSKSHFPNF